MIGSCVPPGSSPSFSCRRGAGRLGPDRLPGHRLAERRGHPGLRGGRAGRRIPAARRLPDPAHRTARRPSPTAASPPGPPSRNGRGAAQPVRRAPFLDQRGGGREEQGADDGRPQMGAVDPGPRGTTAGQPRRQPEGRRRTGDTQPNHRVRRSKRPAVRPSRSGGLPAPLSYSYDSGPPLMAGPQHPLRAGGRGHRPGVCRSSRPGEP